MAQYATNQKVKFFAGHPDDVISRFIGAADKYGIDVIIRITGDCPTISTEVAEYLLKKHFESGADYTAAREYAAGFNSEIYNTSALKKIIQYMSHAPHSENMTWHMQNNQHIFNVNIVDLPKEYIRPYRITLDEQADLDMFNTLFSKLGKTQPNMKNIYKVLDNNPEIPKLNQNIKLKFKVDKNLISMLNKETKIKLKR